MTEAPPSKENKKSGSAFSSILPLIRAADGLTLGQVCALTTLEPSTVQNWIKRGFVPHPEGKKYRERHVARIMLINSLRDCMQIDRIGALMTYINGNADDESDDIISDIALYEIFCEVVGKIVGERLPYEVIGEQADKILDAYLKPSEERGRLKESLTVMATAHIAGLYKKEADRLYQTIFTTMEENHE